MCRRDGVRAIDLELGYIGGKVGRYGRQASRDVYLGIVQRKEIGLAPFGDGGEGQAKGEYGFALKWAGRDQDEFAGRKGLHERGGIG